MCKWYWSNNQHRFGDRFSEHVKRNIGGNARRAFGSGEQFHQHDAIASTLAAGETVPLERRDLGMVFFVNSIYFQLFDGGQPFGNGVLTSSSFLAVLSALERVSSTDTCISLAAALLVNALSAAEA